MSNLKPKKRIKRSRGGTINKFNIASIYVPPGDHRLWKLASERAASLNMTKSQYILTLIESDIISSEKQHEVFKTEARHA